MIIIITIAIIIISIAITIIIITLIIITATISTIRKTCRVKAAGKNSEAKWVKMSRHLLIEMLQVLVEYDILNMTLLLITMIVIIKTKWVNMSRHLCIEMLLFLVEDYILNMTVKTFDNYDCNYHEK